MNGIIVGGFGLGAFIFNQIQTAYLNPGNSELDDGHYFKDEKILQRVPSLFLLLGSIYGVIQVWSTLQNPVHRYLIEVDCSLGQFTSAKMKDKDYTKYLHNIAKKKEIEAQSF